jgi:hypothetical protein
MPFKCGAAVIAHKHEWHVENLSYKNSFCRSGTLPLVYNIQVDDQPEFYANGILVHNCPLCEELEGVILRIEEAHGMLPRHPNCRCSFAPANLGEDEEDQVRGKGAIDKAISRSQKLGGRVDDEGGAWGPGERISKFRPESAFNSAERFAALLNSFCPTEEGGGVDPSYGGGVKGHPSRVSKNC